MNICHNFRVVCIYCQLQDKQFLSAIQGNFPSGMAGYKYMNYDMHGFMLSQNDCNITWHFMCEFQNVVRTICPFPLLKRNVNN